MLKKTYQFEKTTVMACGPDKFNVIKNAWRRNELNPGIFSQISPTVPSSLLQLVAKLQKLESTQVKAVMLRSVDTVAKYNQFSA